MKDEVKIKTYMINLTKKIIKNFPSSTISNKTYYYKE